MAWEPETKARIEMENSTKNSRADGILKLPLVDLRVASTREIRCPSTRHHLPIRSLLYALSLFLFFFFFFLFFTSSFARTLGYSNTASANSIALSNARKAAGKIVIGQCTIRIVV
jgi:hypothetical protein